MNKKLLFVASILLFSSSINTMHSPALPQPKQPIKAHDKIDKKGYKTNPKLNPNNLRFNN